MPFTLAHPVAVLPLRRLSPRRTDATALVVGAMSPDVPYMLLVGPEREVTHTLIATLWFCLPVGMALWVASRLLITPALTDLMPDTVRTRLPPSRSRLDWSAGAVLTAGASVWLGALTHVVWDAFTHWTSPLVQASELLRTNLMTVQLHRVEVYNVLQHGSTIVGLLLLGVWATHRLGRQQPRTSRARLQGRLRMLLQISLVGLPTLLAAAAALERLLLHGFQVIGFTTSAAAAGFTLLPALTYAALLAALGWQSAVAQGSDR